MTPKPITVTDEQGNHLELIVGSDIPRSQSEFWRHATPEDLARAGYVQVDEYNALLRRAGFVTNERELHALRGIEQHLRAQHAAFTTGAAHGFYCSTCDMLKAIDEARKT